MNNLKHLGVILKNEPVIFKIQKKSEMSFIEYAFLLPAIYRLISNKRYNYLIVTKKRILLIIRAKIIKDIQYSNFKSLSYDSINNRLNFRDLKNNKRHIGLNSLHMGFNDIQYLKSKLNE